MLQSMFILNRVAGRLFIQLSGAISHNNISSIMRAMRYVMCKYEDTRHSIGSYVSLTLDP